MVLYDRAVRCTTLRCALPAGRTHVFFEAMFAARVLASFAAHFALDDTFARWIPAVFAIVSSSHHGVVRYSMNWSSRALMARWVLAFVASPSFSLVPALQPIFDSHCREHRNAHICFARHTLILLGGGFVFPVTSAASNKTACALHV